MDSRMYLLLVSLNILPTVLGQKMSDAVIQDLMTPRRDLAEGCGYDRCPMIAENILNVHIVPHSHGEIASSRSFYQHYSGWDDQKKSAVNWKRILDFTVTMLWNGKHRTFVLSDTPYLMYWWAHRDGTVKRMVYQLLREGRLQIVGGGWGMPDESCPSYHAIIDLFTYAFRKLNQTLGPCARPLVGWQVDVRGHSREFANLATMLGYDGLFINPISFEDEIRRMQHKELEMLWRGSDDIGADSDIFTHKLFDGYWAPPGFCFGMSCNDPLVVTFDEMRNNVADRVKKFIDSMRNRQSPNYATNHIMVIMGMKNAYYDAEIWFHNIENLIQHVNENDSSVILRYSTPACYLKAVNTYSPALPVKQDDFLPLSINKNTYFSGMFTSRPAIKYMAREGHVFLQMAKQSVVMARLPVRDTRLYDELTWIVGVFQDHTVITGDMAPHVKDFYTNKMNHAVQETTELMTIAFNKLRNSPSSTIYYKCAFNVSSCRATTTASSYVTIYNPLAWPVTIPVRLPVVRLERYVVFNPKLQRVKAVTMSISPAVLSIPHRDTVANLEVVFLAEDLPPLGFRSYYVEAVPRRAGRRRRSIIKKLRINKKKTYLSRQTDQMKIDDDSMLDAEDEEYQEEYEEPTTGSNETDDIDEEPIFELPPVTIRDNLEFTDVDEGEEKKHRGLFGKAPKPLTKAEEEDSWMLTDNPKSVTVAPYRRRYDKLKRFRDKKAKKLSTTTPKPEEEEDNMKLYNIPPNATTPIPPTQQQITPATKKPTATHTPNPLKKKPPRYPEEKPAIYDSYRKSIEKEHHNVQNKYKLLLKPAAEDATSKNLVTKEATSKQTPEFETHSTSSSIEPQFGQITEPGTDTLNTQNDDQNSDLETLNRIKSLNDADMNNYGPMFRASPVEVASTSTSSTETPTSTPPPDSEEEEEEVGLFRSQPKKFKPKEDDEDGRRLFDKPFRRVLLNRTTPGSTTRRTTTEYNPMDDPHFDESKNYFYKASNDKFIKNRYVKIHLDDNKEVSRVTLSNGVEVDLTIDFYYYASDDPDKLGHLQQLRPGATIFRPMDPQPVKIKDFVKNVVHKTFLVEELQCAVSSWVGFVLRVYVERPVIELDWVVGPVPTEDVGKEVFIRYTTNLATEEVFYTDSNGRQTIKRVRNRRATFEPLLNNIPSNFYPVTSKIHIEDPRKNIRFTVFNDRAQGGTSLRDGQVDLMVHRRILTDDNGIEIYLNDTENGRGVVIRGKHYIYISKADYKPNKIFEKKFAKEIELAPQVFASPSGGKEVWYGQNNEFKGIAKRLPVGVHVLTLEEWIDKTLLLRLENYLEKADALKSGVKTVFIENLFAGFTVKGVKETTLGANVWRKDWVPMRWKTKTKFVKNFNDFYRSNVSTEYSTDDPTAYEEPDFTKGITLTPQQIRTFVISYELK